jgi:hypothetical protein
MNSYSVIHNFDTQNLYKPDFNFINTALSYKQNKLDTNRAKLQNLYDQYSMLKVHNDVDQEYIEKRLESVRDITNKYASMDLSDDNFATSLMGTVSQVLDEKVKNAVLSTKLIESEDAQWAKMKEKNLDKYSDLNRAYALNKSDRRNYENATEAGTVYKGGAGFIEYRDLSKKVMENLPKLQDALKAKWVETGPQQGYFRSLDTYEAIPKNKMEDALELLFDEKDRMQIGINSWGVYDRMSDEQIKQDWDSFYAPKKEEAEEQIRNLEIAKADPKKYGLTSESIDRELESWRKVKTNYDNYTYDKVMETSGREGAYTTLYNNKYKGQILDTYSKPKTLIERKVDDIQKANLEYQQKIDQFNANYALDVEKFLWSKEKFAIEQANKGKSGSSSSSSGAGGQDGVIMGDLKTLEYDEVDNEIIENQKAERAAMDGIKNLVGSYVPRDSFAELSKEMADLAGKAKRNETITINGKKVPVKENLSVLLAFKDNILEETPVEKAIKQDLQNMTGQVVGNLRQLVQSGSADFDVTNLPEFTWKIEVDPTTGAQKKVPLKNMNSQNYVRLLKKEKEKLTESEKATLKAYSQLHMIGDEGLKMTGGVRKELFKTLRDNTLGNMSSKEFAKSFGGSEKDVINAFQIQSFTGTQGTEYGDQLRKASEQYQRTGKKEDKDKMEKILISYNERKNLLKPMKGEGGYLSDLEAHDTEYYNKQGKEVSLNNFVTVVKNAMGTLNNDITEMKKQWGMLSYSTPSITPDNPAYDEIKNLMVQQGQIVSDYKGFIKIDPQIDSKGKETGQVQLTAYEKVKGTPVQRSAVISSDRLRQTGFNLEPISRKPYSAAYGENARKIQLGNATPKNDPNNYIVNNLDGILSQAKSLGVEAGVKNLVTQYYNGQIDFSVEASNGLYNVIARDSKGNILPGSYPIQETELDYRDVEELYNNSDRFTDSAMQNVLNQYMSTAAVQKKLELQEDNVLSRLK